jgi:hypothetical protein
LATEIRQTTDNSSLNEIEKRELIGLQSEIIVLSLLNRFAINEIGDGSWYALPSTLSQDFHVERTLSGANWDISVFTSAEGEVVQVPSYKVQVKSSKFTKDEVKEYDQDVVVVYICPDLQIDGYILNTRGVICAELAYERQNIQTSRISASLDRRTDQLLELLG